MLSRRLMTSLRPVIVIVTKRPVAGNVKTRLAADLGYGRAAAVFRHLLRLTIARARHDQWELALAVDVNDPGPIFSTTWKPQFARLWQGKGGLSDRLNRIIKANRGRPILIIGADAPGLHRQYLVNALKGLRRHDVVFGPAEDGGFWLMGLSGRRPAPDLFCGVRWSSSHALSDTRRSLPKGWTVGEVEPLADIDNLDEWRNVARQSGGVALHLSRAPHSDLR